MWIRFRDRFRVPQFVVNDSHSKIKSKQFEYMRSFSRQSMWWNNKFKVKHEIKYLMIIYTSIYFISFYLFIFDYSYYLYTNHFFIRFHSFIDLTRTYYHANNISYSLTSSTCHYFNNGLLQYHRRCWYYQKFKKASSCSFKTTSDNKTHDKNENKI
jgi:hypothetical protein